jgi:histidinol-phosphate aminotransferase
MNTRRAFLRGIVATAALTQFAPTLLGSSSVLALVEGPYSATNQLMLNSNENAMGMSPAAKAAGKKALEIGNRYPDTGVNDLRRKVAAREGLRIKNAIIGSGSTDILIATTIMFSNQGGTVVAPGLTYGQVQTTANNLGMPYKAVPLRPDFSIDLAAMEKASLALKGPVLVYMVTPNNPTGLVVPSAELFAWVKRAPSNIFFLMDEAYHDFVTTPEYQSAVPFVKEGMDNLIVARTFSKVYGMAGMRIGYGLGTEKVINEVSKFYESWNINISGAMAASVAFDDKDWLNTCLQENEKARQITHAGLDELGLNYIPSQTNFMIHEIKSDLKAYQKRMLDNHVLVGRDMGLGVGWNRLSFGTADEMKHFVGVLKEFRKKGWV